MNREQMNVHKALAELKVLDSRIDSKIDSTTFCVANRHSNTKINGKGIEDFKSEVKSNYDSITDLIARRSAIKRAVVLSNATTKVTINDVEYTVAEAIEMHNHGLEFKQHLYAKIYNNFSQVKSACNQKNNELEQKTTKYITEMFGVKETNTSNDNIEKARKAYEEQNTYEVIDSIDCEKVIEELSKEIDAFVSEVDSVLSVSNAITLIDIEY